MKKVAWVGILGLLVGCGTIGAEPTDGGGAGSGGTVVTGAAGQATGGSSGPGGATGTAGMTGAAGQGTGGAGRGGAAGGPGVAGAGGTASGGRGGAGGTATGGAGGTAGSTARGGAGGTAGSGPGGSTARGGTGGGAAGSTGRGGTGGGTVTCASLENDYSKALSAARQCNATKPNQCQELVHTSLACPNCQTHVNDASQLKELTTMWTKLGCDKELRICPAVICQLPGPGSCVPISSGDVCMDGKLIIDPPPISL